MWYDKSVSLEKKLKEYKEEGFSPVKSRRSSKKR